MKTFTLIYYEEPNRGPGEYLRATVVAEDHNAAFNKFRDEHPVAGDGDEDTGVAADEDDEELPERINIICAIEGDLDIHWNYD